MSLSAFLTLKSTRTELPPGWCVSACVRIRNHPQRVLCMWGVFFSQYQSITRASCVCIGCATVNCVQYVRRKCVGSRLMALVKSKRARARACWLILRVPRTLQRVYSENINKKYIIDGQNYLNIFFISFNFTVISISFSSNILLIMSRNKY
ncbi:uncharacterized protein LOC141529828 [Cotesia typhae]|uniref:uncharacterized protein LOC141529828 n=1 Tax=Cotesia typhae TaxID=2053667 RepID=UPI003D687B5C